MCCTEEGLGYFHSATQQKKEKKCAAWDLRDKVVITERNRKEIAEYKIVEKGEKRRVVSEVSVAWEYYAKNHSYHY